MASNTVSDSIMSEEGIKVERGKLKEILCGDYYYDVTDFISKHPGGSIIDYYTHLEEDATHAIQQFHYRSRNKVELMMKALKRRPATNRHEIMDPDKLKRHQALTEDFNKLYLEIEKEGLFEPSYLHILLRWLEILTMGFVGYYLLFFQSYLLKFVGSLIIGLASGKTAWIQHESGHNSFTGNPKIDRIQHAISVGVGMGMSSTWWTRGHNKHHAMPQRINHDVDLATLPFVAHNTKCVKNRKTSLGFFIQYQAYLFLSLTTFVTMVLWKFYLQPRYALRNGYYFQGLCILGHFAIGYQLGLVPFLIATWFQSLYDFGTIALNHSHLPVTEEYTHWVEYSLIHTADITSHWFIDWWMSYVNYQIEHHLFPTMPNFRNHLVRHRVRALAEKHNIPYHVFTYTEAVWKFLGNLKEVSKELRLKMA